MMPVSETLYGRRSQGKDVNDVHAQGYIKMGTLKVLRPFFALAMPVLNVPPLIVILHALLAAIATFLTPMNLVLKLMLVAIFFDVFTGICCRISKKAVTQPQIGPIAILVKFGCYALASYLAKQPELIWDVWGKTWGVGEFVGLWYLVVELASITMNLDDLKMPLPKSLKKLVAAIHSSIDNADISGSAVSMITSFSKRTEDGVQTVKEVTSKTTVTPSAAAPTEKPDGERTL